MEKRLLATLIIAVMLISSIGTAFAAEDSKTITVFVDGKEIAFDVPPTSENGRTLVPMRYIFEALGAEVDWIQDENKAVATKGDIIIELTLGSNVMTRNGRQILLDVPAKAIDGRTLVPARAVAEALDAKVDWIEEKYKVDITAANSEPAILSETEAQVRIVMQEYADANEKLDIRKICQLTVDGEKILEVIPEGDIAAFYAEASLKEIKDMEALMELPDGYIKAMEDYIKVVINGIFDAIKTDASISIVDVREENGKYIYTIETKMRDIESLDGEKMNSILAEDGEQIINDIKAELEAKGKITADMSEEEIGVLTLVPLGEALVEIISKEIHSLDFTTLTEEVTIVNIDGKWLIEDGQLSLEQIQELVGNLGL